MGFVYLARNRVNNRRYVGKTVGTLSRRKSKHERGAIRGDIKVPFVQAIAKYGKEAFEWCVLFESSDEKELLRVERVMIATLRTKTPRGYNVTLGGEGSSGFKHSVESRKKMSASGTGRKTSDETRAKQSAAAKGRVVSEATRRKSSLAQKGKKNSPESRAKMSASRLGKKLSPRHCASISAGNKGKKHRGYPRTQAHTEKIAAWHRGRKRPEATREKLRAAWVRRKQRALAASQASDFSGPHDVDPV